MHVVFLADESVLPVDHGGRLVMSNDIKALRAAGITVSIVVSVDEAQPADMHDHYAFEFVSATHFVPQRPVSAARRAHPLVPRATASRMPVEEELLKLRAFLDTQPVPDAIVATRETSLLLGAWISESSVAPLILRSQNDEVDYWRGAAADSDSAQEARLLRSEARLLSAGLRRLLRPVRAVALISPDDARRYERLDTPCSVIPALVAEPPVTSPVFEERGLKVAFVGSLGIPHTAAGLRWFVESAWPIVREAVPAAELMIAGRGASDALVETFERVGGVAHLGRVERVQPVLDDARVFVNPVFRGSGVNMKLAEPAASGLPIVATRFGMRGASALTDIVAPTDDAEELARQTIRYLQDAQAWSRASDALRDVMASRYSRTASAVAWREFLLSYTGTGVPRDVG